jgi:hypothetical protein
LIADRWPAEIKPFARDRVNVKMNTIWTRGPRVLPEITQQYVDSESDYEQVKENNKVHGRADQINNRN